MPTELQIRIPLPLARTVLGAAITSFGILLIIASHIAAGSTLSVLGILVGFGRTVSAAIYFVAAALFFWAGIGLMFLYDSLYDTRTFAEWTADSWGVYVYFGLIASSILVTAGVEERSAWSGLKQGFSDIGDWIPRPEGYVSAAGIMSIDQDQFPVSVLATEVGVVVVNESGKCLLFKWERVGELNSLGNNGDRARIKILREMPLPMYIEVPWNEQFNRFVPSRLKHDGI